MCAVADLVNADPVVSRRMKVVFMENFGVTMGQRIYPAADISEQIPPPEREASGTGCMKFMMNGADASARLTARTSKFRARRRGEHFDFRPYERGDRALHHAGRQRPQMRRERSGTRARARPLTDGSLGSKFWDLEDALSNINDEFFVLRAILRRISRRGTPSPERPAIFSFQRKALVNIAKSGWFSSDRAVAEYVSDIWKIR